MYHRVVEVLPVKKTMGARIEIDKSHFTQQLDFFEKYKYRFISLDELYNNLLADKPFSKFACLTFDDGYQDNLQIAYPILKERNIPFCIYITTDFPDHKAVLWWYLFDDLFTRNKQITVSINNIETIFDCASQIQRDHSELALRRMIKKCPPQDLDSLLYSIFILNGVELFEKTKELALSWNEIRKLSADPLVTIGAHSVHHHALANLPPEILIQELLFSKNIIEGKISKSVNHFAYPYGSKSEAGKREFTAAEECGFKTAVTSRMANIFPQHKHHLNALPRLEMPLLENDHALRMAVNGLIQAKRYRLRRVVWDN